MATGQSPQQKVDLDLDVLAPPARTFKLDGKVYRLPREIPLLDLLDAFRLDQRFRASTPGSEEMEAALREIYEMVLGYVRSANDKAVESLPLTESGLGHLWALLLGGTTAENLQEAVHEILEMAGAEVDEEGQVQGLPPTPRKRGKQAGDRGRSKKASPARSSG